MRRSELKGRIDDLVFRIMRLSRPIFGTILLLVLVGGVSTRFAGQTENPQAEKRAAKARFQNMNRGSVPGEVWLSWQTPVRTWYVEGALGAYRDGYDRGCKDALSRTSTSKRGGRSNREDVCPDDARESGNALRYAVQMTEFYRRYPDDRDLPISYLVRMLIGAKPKTLEEIHAWISTIDR